MYRIWLLLDPRRSLTLLFTLLCVLALFIHFMLMTYERFAWIAPATAEGPTVQEMPLP